MMRSAALVFALLTQSAQSAQAQTAALQGTVTDSQTHQPLPGVHITALPLDNSDAIPSVSYGAITQRDGTFSIATLKPATYILIPRRNGYVFTHSREAAITLKPGEVRTGISIELVPQAVITGRVTDEFGDPVRNAGVDATLTSGASTESLGPSGLNVRTDERGQFRLTGPPGKYHVAAAFTPQRFNPDNVPEVRTDGTQPAVYAITWYPASDSKDHAGIVEVAAGREATGIDIRLVRQRNLTISGVVSGIPGPTNNRATIQLAPDGSDPEWYKRLRNTWTAADGKFQISAVTPGAYRLWAMASGERGTTPLRTPFVDIRIESTDETVNLKLVPGEELAGTLALEGASEIHSISLETLMQLKSAYSQQTAETDKDGAFKFTSIFPDKYRARVTPLPDNAYIKSIRLDSAESPGDILDLSNGVHGSRIRIAVSRNGAQLEGAVVEEDGQPQRTPMIFLWLAANPDDLTYESMKRVVPGSKFSFNGIRPGKYRLISIDPLTTQDDLGAAKEAFPKSPEIEFREGDRITKDIKHAK